MQGIVHLAGSAATTNMLVFYRRSHLDEAATIVFVVFLRQARGRCSIGLYMIFIATIFVVIRSQFCIGGSITTIFVDIRGNFPSESATATKMVAVIHYDCAA